MAVIKADAYGHGATPIANVLLQEGFTHFMVATLSEAMRLRTNGLKAPILVGTPPLPANLPLYSAQEFHVSVSTPEAGHAIIAAGRQGLPLNVHIKLDTGMGRLGLSIQEAAHIAQAIQPIASIELTGIWTHLATASDEDTAYAREQVHAFYAFVDRQESFHGITHVGNSSSLLHPAGYLPKTPRSMYRVGGALLGMSAQVRHLQGTGIAPILTFTAWVLAVKNLEAGDSVSYGRTWKAAQATRIAVIGAGYADGYPGTLFPGTGKHPAAVAINGDPYPVIGNVCMDMFMVEMTHVPPGSHVKAGDEVILFGKGGPDIQTVALQAGRKPYEICCGLSQRVPRIYQDYR